MLDVQDLIFQETTFEASRPSLVGRRPLLVGCEHIHPVGPALRWRGHRATRLWSRSDPRPVGRISFRPVGRVGHRSGGLKDRRLAHRLDFQRGRSGGGIPEGDSSTGRKE